VKKGSIDEYLAALQGSEKFGSQVVWVEKIAGRNAVYADPAEPWPVPLQSALADMGMTNGLYQHQAEAVNTIRSGGNLIVATPTASGKSLIYNLPVFEHLLAHPDQHALYLFPLKALAQDQLQVIEKISLLLPENSRPRSAIYDGDTSAYFRKKLRDFPPHILISNPDMLHLSMLPYHGQWGGFWSGLSYVIIDEVHTYRGVFGSHMAWVLRRLKRISMMYGSTPTFILSSATVGNPENLAENLLGQSARALTLSGAPQGERSFVFLDPYDSPAYTASQLLEAALKRGLRTIVYTQSRKMTELVSMWTSARLGELRGKLAAYRAGFLPEERREIEGKLASGELLGVVSTSALELGIDIGELELCILVGYPGSIMATWQRGGRVGRRQDDSAVILIAQEDALDKHFMRNPSDFFRRGVEAAVLNPANREIMKKHLLCAAAESPIGINEPILTKPDAGKALEELNKQGQLLLGADGKDWFTTRKYPHREVDLRGSGRSFAIRNSFDNTLLGEIDPIRCLKECHPGAVYLQKGATLLVDALDLDGHEVKVHAQKVSYFTRALSQKETEILDIFATKKIRNFKVSFGRLRVTDQVSGFQRRSVKGQRVLSRESLDLPPNVFETEGLWIYIPAALEKEAVRRQIHFMGGIHALEHAAIGVFPLLILCDRNDVGGISTPFHHQAQSAAVFIYDGYSGGIGLSRQVFDQVEELMLETLQTIESCGCDVGCPSCVHSPKCGSGNRPIDKKAALFLLKSLLTSSLPGEEQSSDESDHYPLQPTNHAADFQPSAIPDHFAVFDVETKHSAADVGGWHRAELMGVSVAVLYDSKTDDYFTFYEDEINKLINHLQQVQLVVGFNNKRFDYRVLSAYTRFDLHDLPTLDILEEVTHRLGYRLSLDRLAEHTLGVTKTADGLQALKWYKEGRMDDIAQYCKKDVEITRDLFLFGLKKGYLIFQNKAGHKVRCPFELPHELLDQH
jgi:DEAD/DEAH box helicase domain-containing protein